MFSTNDSRSATYIARTNIGFLENTEDWKYAPAVFSNDRLEIVGHPVMESWEYPYMKELAEIVTSNGGRILEIGFGLGIAANLIQTNNIEEHTVIEANYQVFQKLLEFQSNSKKKVTAIFGFWQEVINEFENESFDGILFDTYPLTEKEIHSNHFSFFEHAYRLLKKGGILTYYSDEVSSYSKYHYDLLYSAGFSKIQSRICKINPPASCLYWNNKSILVPIIFK